MRLIITGKTRSGKSTAVHRLLATALRHEWAGILLLDGKGNELKYYQSLPNVTYLGPKDIETWVAELERLAENLADRYDSLTERGLREAAPGDPRWFIVADEVQKGTRAKQIGKRIKDALGLIAEQSASLGDVLILSSQREPNAIPPSVRENANAYLRMLGNGYFFYRADGHPTQSGRVAYITPTEALAIINGQPSPNPQSPNLQPPTSNLPPHPPKPPHHPGHPCRRADQSPGHPVSGQPRRGQNPRPAPPP
jgi:hypothetical protein